MVQIEKGVTPPAPTIHPTEAALTLLRDQGEPGDSIVLTPELARAARAYYPRVATDTRVFEVHPEGDDGSVRVWLRAAAPPQVPRTQPEPDPPMTQPA